MSSSKIRFTLLWILVAVMPLHYYICEIFIKGSLDNLWRDLLLLLILFITIVPEWKIKTGKMGLSILLFFIVCFVSALLSYFTNGYEDTWNILRTYCIPMLSFFCILNTDVTYKEWSKICCTVVYVAVFEALYGLFQAFVLGQSFLVSLGYPSSNGYLNSSGFFINGFYGQQRVVGTFASANDCGLFLVISLCLLLYSGCFDHKKTKTLFEVILIVGLVGTFSRSAIIAFVLVVIYHYGLKRETKIGFEPNKLLKMFICIIFAVIIVLTFDHYLFNDMFSNMIYKYTIRTLSGNDESATKHISDLVTPLITVISNPFGIGFGNNGPLAINYSSTATGVESSLYLICYDTGWLGLATYFIPVLSGFAPSHVLRDKVASVSSACICLAIFVVFLVLPEIQTYEIAFYLFLFAGFGYKEKAIVVA